MPSLETARALGETTHSRFISRIYSMRMLGTGLAGICVAGSLWEHGTPGWGVWAILAFHIVAWPQLAHLHVRKSDEPVKAEFANLTGDAAIGGFWIATMHFDILPSAMLAVWMTMDKIIIGGMRFANRTMSAMAVTCLATAALNGFAFDPRTGQLTIFACLPFLILYPIAIGFTTRSLANKVHRQKRMLEHAAHFDAATDLANRQHWFYVAGDILQQFHAGGRPASLMMIDIDHFKEINDNLGHAAGDIIIAEFAELLKSSVRDHDTPGRYGGDEFGVLLPNTPAARAAEAAERLRARVEAHAFIDGLISCTVSIGIAETNARMRNLNDWMRKADSALYRAKSAGRNQVQISKG